MKLLKFGRYRMLFLISALSVGGCSIFNREVDNIEISPSPKVMNQLSLIESWTAGVEGHTPIYSLLGPANYGDVVYLASRDGQIKAISIKDGNKTLWKTSVAIGSLFNHKPALLSGGLSADGKYVYVGSEKAIVYAIDGLTGKIVWQQDVAGEVLAKPVSAGGVLLIHTSNGFLQALNSETGSLIWQTYLDVPPLSLRGQSMPTIDHNIVFVGDSHGYVNAVALKNGLLIWKQRISQPGGATEIARLSDVDASPVVIGNVVYALGYNGNMVGLDVASGQLLWHRNIGAIHNFIVNGDRIYLVDKNDSIKSLNLDGGALMWQQNNLKNRRLTDPILYKGYIVVGDFEGYLYLLALKTGDFVYKTRVNAGGLLSSPIVVNDQLIVQGQNGTVHAFIL